MKALIDCFTILCSVTWSLNGSEAGGDLALIQTSLLFSFKWQRVSVRKLDLPNKTSEVCIKTRSPPASLPFKGLATKQATGKMLMSIVMDSAHISVSV